MIASLLAFLALSGSRHASYAATHPPVYAGTYAVRFCRGACTGTKAGLYGIGTMVLFARPMLAADGRVLYRQLQPGPVNGCMALKISPQASGEVPYPGDPPASDRGFFTWAQAGGGGISFQLDRSPDGGYGVDLKLVAMGLAGKGMAWGGAIGAPAGGGPAPFDQVVAERIGGPDAGRCPPLPPVATVHGQYWLP